MSERLKRLDLLVMESRGFSREYAREVIEAGMVRVNGKTVVKPGSKFDRDGIEVLAPDMPFVGRGGYKLDAAFKAFGIDVAGKVCADIGASTGGFTDCMLKRGAAKVYAVDVGRGQLADSLRVDDRVVVMEETDVRGLLLPELADFAAADVSFISLTKVIGDLGRLIKAGGGLVCLIKPEFETGGRYLNKKGVVANARERERASNGVTAALEAECFKMIGFMESPVTGRNGNVEYLVYCVNQRNL